MKKLCIFHESIARWWKDEKNEKWNKEEHEKLFFGGGGATSMAYRSYQARDWIQATDASAKDPFNALYQPGIEHMILQRRRQSLNLLCHSRNSPSTF